MGNASDQQFKLILASASPRRLDLLAQIGVRPDLIQSVDTDETILPGELPREAVERLAQQKSEAARVLRRGARDLILTADTIVACGRRILGKPRDEDEAAHMLSLLSGRRHKVMTSVCLTKPDDEVLSRTVVTRVAFKRLGEVEQRAYLASGEWNGKAGAYAIQGYADSFVKAIEGSYSNVVGLPLLETTGLLTGAGYNIHEAWHG